MVRHALAPSLGLCVLTAALVIAPRAIADPILQGVVTFVQDKTTGAPFGGNGGDFIFSNSPGITPTALPSGTFTTFCVEVNETIALGQKYWAEIGTAAYRGGGGAVAGADPLDVRTAWLFEEFLDGHLGGFTGNEVQAAIWVLEQEITTTNANVNTLVTMASNSGRTSLGDVRVMNLYTLNSTQDGRAANATYHQSQIVRIQAVPLPATAGTALLILGGLGLTSRLRRRLAR